MGAARHAAVDGNKRFCALALALPLALTDDGGGEIAGWLRGGRDGEAGQGCNPTRSHGPQGTAENRAFRRAAEPTPVLEAGLEGTRRAGVRPRSHERTNENVHNPWSRDTGLLPGVGALPQCPSAQTVSWLRLSSAPARVGHSDAPATLVRSSPPPPSPPPT